ncbi:glycosyltransferase [Wenyingzhuangia fucanilytica]|nr:glycosyltransferase [Wenyingzhuangia fucanilytica]
MIHFGYYTIVFNFFNFTKTSQKANNNIPVSVIVCAKNEAENLKNYLPYLINQKYDEFELVLINDRSYDETADIFETYEQQYDFVKVVTIQETDYFYGNKKYALTLGIKAAKHDCLLLTDADCQPNSEYWIQEMANQFTQNKEVVLGYGAYQDIPKSFINKMIRYETLMTALQYFSFAQIGIPYMGVGRNLMYSKTLFLKNKGFHQHIRVMSGDDDLLINQIANKQNTAICFDENAHTTSPPKLDRKSWTTQKRRHISTANLYKPLHKFLLGLYTFNRLLFWLVLPASLIYVDNTNYQLIIAGLIAIKLISEYIVVGIAAKKLKEKGLVLFTPILDICLLFFQLYIFIYNNIHKPQKWS